MSGIIKPSTDRKTQFYKGQQNTFGLLPGKEGTCPGCTTEKGGCWYKAPGRKTHTCYVDNLMRIYGGVKGALTANTVAAKAGTEDEVTAMLDAEFRRFEDAEAKHAAKTGGEEHLFYRLHWSGDVFSEVYAKALVKAMTAHPRITFWSYTRNFDVVPILLQAENMVLHLSLDPVNLVRGLQCYEDNGGPGSDRLQLCYMCEVNNIPELKPDLKRLFSIRNDLRAAVGLKRKSLDWLDAMELVDCPVDSGKIPTDMGCSNCRACLRYGKHMVWFKS